MVWRPAATLFVARDLWKIKTQIKIETGEVRHPSIFKIKLSEFVIVRFNTRTRLSNSYVVEPKDESSPRTIGLLLGICGKSTQIKIEKVVVTGPSIFDLNLSDFVVITFNNQNRGSSIPML